MQRPQLYIDSEGVERGYYVYAHTCEASGRVFYVGKGKEDRAWSDNRSSAWHEYVASLPEGYRVCLLHSDLTEEEAIKLEQAEIEAYGGPASAGGTLVNWIPGEYGEGFGVAAEVVVDLTGGDEDLARSLRFHWEKYRAARKFKELSPSERKACAEKFDEMAGPAINALYAIKEKYVFRTDTLEPFGIISAISKASEIGRLARQLRNRKMGYLDFCYAVEDQLGQLTRRLERRDVEPEYAEIIEAVHGALVRWFSLFDTGNEQEARAIASREYGAWRDRR
ncbi:MAG: hypothetical protein ACKO1M_12615 [Planctomycetota bacterium]